MVIAFGIVALVFFALSFILTQNNGAQLLSGYNTLSDEERNAVDLNGYITYFRKFFRFFSIIYFVLGLLLYYFVDTDVAGIFLAIAPLLAVFIQTYKSSKYIKEKNNKSTKIALIILTAIIVFVGVLLAVGYKENEIIVEKSSLTITGVYGETIQFVAIDSLALLDSLPAIRMKTNGFALGSASKGKFTTKAGEAVTLILNRKQSPYLFLQKTDGTKIYYAADSAKTKQVYDQLKNSLATY